MDRCRVEETREAEMSVPGTEKSPVLGTPVLRKTGQLVALAGMDKSMLEALLTPGLIWPQLLML